ncbi:nuclear transport factor 2 family protein [Hymenobacter sp. BT664]|uniref:Nuclear transport factor 2 family protein n=1 Tax=Hymenobacter montanus TaxID=2771359 RepID=A0A927GLC2_9BACT|nr:nuclear transport factor 2 family protein [Hymenobacter montanus]MBD2770513.1 nuclear transport factor 2 family protein [Hymenobacter montanus]
MEEQLKEIIERTQISDLHLRYFRAIDEKQLDRKIVEVTFTTDAQVSKPNGAVSIGHDEILDGHIKSFARFQATQHTTSDFIIEFGNDKAIVRTNLTAMHVWADIAENPSLNSKHFYAGGVLLTKAIKAGNKWRISEWIFRNVWRTGEGMDEMAKFARPE